MLDNTITLVGNLTAEPELRYTAAGTPVANFTIASSPRVFDKDTGQWRDGDTLFLRCTVWQKTAENLADSVTRGTRVIVTGKLRQRSFESREGEKRTSVELQVDEIGVSLRSVAVAVTTTTQNSTSEPTTVEAVTEEPPH